MRHNWLNAACAEALPLWSPANGRVQTPAGMQN